MPRCEGTATTVAEVVACDEETIRNFEAEARRECTVVSLLGDRPAPAKLANLAKLAKRQSRQRPLASPARGIAFTGLPNRIKDR